MAKPQLIGLNLGQGHPSECQWYRHGFPQSRKVVWPLLVGRTMFLSGKRVGFLLGSRSANKDFGYFHTKTAIQFETQINPGS